MTSLSYEPKKRNTGTLWLSFLFLCACAACVTCAVYLQSVRTLFAALAAAFFIVCLQLFLTGAMRSYIYTVQDDCFRVYVVVGRHSRKVCDVDLRLISSLTRRTKAKLLRRRFGEIRKIYNFSKSVSKKSRAELVYAVSGVVYLAYFDCDDAFFSGLSKLLPGV